MNVTFIPQFSYSLIFSSSAVTYFPSRVQVTSPVVCVIVPSVPREIISSSRISTAVWLIASSTGTPVIG